jgi:hypothetical protein
MPVPNQALDFHWHILWSFFSIILGERLLFGFFYVGGIIDHHCLKLSFHDLISPMQFTK